ncbi:hypothetical protein [Geminicoccus roseus]|uniref:hypothetical protein n=1 Tax=Geminicoccus roseus TaxID=404900 RepID=UPI0004036B62|nr:hypothetical protein [Geminicoccus roseus]
MTTIRTRLAAWLRPARTSPATSSAADAPPCPVFARWGAILDPHPQVPKVIEIFAHGEREVICFRLSAGEGEWTKYFMFFVSAPGSSGSPCPEMIVSAGSYRFTNAHRGSEGRRYHLDLYQSDDHATLWIQDHLPAYETLRQEVVDLLDSL